METSVVSISGFRWCDVHDGSSAWLFKEHIPYCGYGFFPSASNDEKH
ncbi:hypothetical protein CDBH8_0063 [Corynebacterium diphtheriae BH8]|nr:hypothetical protein CDBH8_0063 [Corynebacterium diphtheriae BH8]